VLPRIVYLEMGFDYDTNYRCSRVWSQTSVDGPESLGFFDMEHQSEEARDSQGPEPVLWARCRSIPSILMACKESRLVAERCYTKSFGTKYSAPSTWFNSDLDTFYLNPGNTFEANEEANTPDFVLALGDLSDDIERVKQLAIAGSFYGDAFYGDSFYGDSHRDGSYVDNVLSCFGHVERLTIAVTQDDEEDCSNPVLLEWSDVMENPEYLMEDEEPAHPICAEVFPYLDLEVHLWRTCEGDVSLWREAPYSVSTRLNDRKGDGERKWKLPFLQCKPIVGLQRKLDFFRRKAEYDRIRDARIVRVTVTSEKYLSLEVSVHVSTTYADIASMFCRERGVDLEGSDESIYLDIKLAGEYCDISSEAKLHDCLAIDDEHTTVDLAFNHELYGRNCSCENMACHHTEKYHQTLWMESENWGVQCLFEGMEGKSVAVAR
jgi:hypothetical protein